MKTQEITDYHLLGKIITYIVDIQLLTSTKEIQKRGTKYYWLSFARCNVTYFE